jgi:hypothetical protein
LESVMLWRGYISCLLGIKDKLVMDDKKLCVLSYLLVTHPLEAYTEVMTLGSIGLPADSESIRGGMRNMSMYLSLVASMY